MTLDKAHPEIRAIAEDHSDEAHRRAAQNGWGNAVEMEKALLRRAGLLPPEADPPEEDKAA